MGRKSLLSLRRLLRLRQKRKRLKSQRRLLPLKRWSSLLRRRCPLRWLLLRCPLRCPLRRLLLRLRTREGDHQRGDLLLDRGVGEERGAGEGGLCRGDHGHEGGYRGVHHTSAGVKRL